MVAFHWLSCHSLSLAELLPDKENSFFLLLAVAKQCHFLPEMQSMSLPVKSVLPLSGKCMRAPLLASLLHFSEFLFNFPTQKQENILERSKKKKKKERVYFPIIQGELSKQKILERYYTNDYNHSLYFTSFIEV